MLIHPWLSRSIVNSQDRTIYDVCLHPPRRSGWKIVRLADTVKALRKSVKSRDLWSSTRHDDQDCQRCDPFRTDRFTPFWLGPKSTTRPENDPLPLKNSPFPSEIEIRVLHLGNQWVLNDIPWALHLIPNLLLIFSP
jgi:hypothetical protein